MRLLKLIFTLVILILSAWLVYANWSEITRAGELPLRTILLACTFSLVNLWLSAEQIRACFQIEIKKSLTVGQWFRYFVAGRLANSVLAESGTIYRALQLKSAHAVYVHQFIAANAFAAWINILLIIGIAGVVIPISGLFQGSQAHWLYAGLFLVFAICAILPWFLQKAFPVGMNHSASGNRFVVFSQNLLSVFQETRVSQGTIPLVAILGIGNLTVATTVIFIISSSLLGEFTIAGAILLSLTLKLSTLVSLTPGNVGIREAMMEVVLHLVVENIALGAGVLISLMLRAIGLLVVVPLGSIFLLLENREDGYNGKASKP